MHRLLSLGVVLLALGPGAAVAAAQYPSTASFVASDSPDRWNAAGGGNRVEIALGGTVSFDSATSEPHDASFQVPSGVACTVGGGGPVLTRIPSTPSANWNGNCTFSEPGYRAFVCTVHSDMTGEVAVAGADGVLPPRGPVVTSPDPTPIGTFNPPAPNPVGGPPAAGPAAGPAAAALALVPVFTFARSQRGSTLRGTIANAGPGATATIDISARKRELSTARRKPTGTTRLRRLTRATNANGSVTVASTLPVLARRALLRRGRLVLTLRATVKGSRIASGGATRTQQITLLAKR